MRVSIEWLKEYVSTLLEDVNEMAERLAMTGFMLDKPIEKVGDDRVLDLEFRRNRSDCEGMVGMAREVAVAVGGELTLPEMAELKDVTEMRECELKITSPELVNRFFAAHVKVKVKDTPEWMKKRLDVYGMEASGNSVIDTTNYVMLELGQPMHAFDLGVLKKVEGDNCPVLDLRKAKTGETLVVLGKKKVALVDDDLLVAGSAKPLALAGVIGGLESGVSENTSEIVLEAANYNRVSIRLTARRIGLMTEAADRLQKDLDPNMAELAIRRAVFLLQQESEGQLVGIKDYYPSPVRPKLIEFNPSEIMRYGGVEVPEFDTAQILEKLGFIVDRKRQENKVWNISVPTFRTDVELPVDIVEEVLRIWGYDKIPTISMETSIPAPIHMKEYEFEDKARDLLTAMGMDELITIGATTLAGLKRAYKDPENEEIFTAGEQGAKAIKIETPPTEYYQYLRTNMFATILDNVKAKVEDCESQIAVFEVGRTYFSAPNKKINDPKLDVPYIEKRKIAGVLSGDFSNAKGVLAELIDELGISYEWKPSEHPSFEDGATLGLFVKGKLVGQVGELAGSVLKGWDIKVPLFGFELDTDFLAYAEMGYKDMSRWSAYPKVTRDISVIVADDVKNADLAEVIQTAGGDILYSVEPVDVYCGEKMPKGKKNIVYSIVYWSKKGTLTTSKVEARHKKVGGALIKKFKAKISGWGQAIVSEVKEPAEQSFKGVPIKIEDTVLQYYENMDTYSSDATVVKVKNKGSQVVELTLDKTLFFPKGGGQPSDQGTMSSVNGEVKVEEVRVEDKKVIHRGVLTGTLKVGDIVKLSVDKKRRNYYMKIHSAGHLLHDVLMSVTKGLKPTKGEHGDDPYIEYSGTVEQRILDKLQEKVNKAVSDDLPIVCKSVSYDELVKMCKHVPANLPKNKQLRVLKIGKYDAMPDGGLQVKSTSLIGGIKITHAFSNNGKTRVSYKVVDSLAGEEQEDGAIVVGAILKVEKHPDADKLVIVTVDLGDKYPEYKSGEKQIVCGAENIVNGGEKVIGSLVPVALPGAKVQMATNKERIEHKECEVKPAKIRGIKSYGMLCSKVELGKGKDDSGIWILPADKYSVGEAL